jgi:hypothetical protein
MSSVPNTRGKNWIPTNVLHTPPVPETRPASGGKPGPRTGRFHVFIPMGKSTTKSLHAFTAKQQKTLRHHLMARLPQCEKDKLTNPFIKKVIKINFKFHGKAPSFN